MSQQTEMSLEAVLSLGELQNTRISARGRPQAGNVMRCSSEKFAVSASKARMQCQAEVYITGKRCGSYLALQCRHCSASSTTTCCGTINPFKVPRYA